MILAILTTGWGVPQASQSTFCWYGYEDLVLFCHDCTFLKKKNTQQQQEYLWCILCFYVRPAHYKCTCVSIFDDFISPWLGDWVSTSHTSCWAFTYTALSLILFIWHKALLLVQITPLLMFCECFFSVFAKIFAFLISVTVVPFVI